MLEYKVALCLEDCKFIVSLRMKKYYIQQLVNVLYKNKVKLLEDAWVIMHVVILYKMFVIWDIIT